MRNDPTYGFSFVLKGFELIRQPKLRRFVVIPCLINVLLFVLMMATAAHFFGELDTWLAGKLPSWLQWLSWLLWLIFAASSFMVIAYTFTLLANLIGAPFNSLLAEQVELYLGNTPPSAVAPWHSVFKDIPRSITRELRKLLHYLPRLLICGLLFFIPVVQTIAPIVWVIFNAWMLGFQYLDYPMDNHRRGIPEFRAWLKPRRFTTLGFGGGVLVITLIPIVNFIAMPVAVAGATALFVEQDSQ